MGDAAAGRASSPVEAAAGRGPRVRPLPRRVRPRGRGPAGRAAGRPPEPARALHLHQAGDQHAARGVRAAPLAPARRHLSRPVRADRLHRHAAQRGHPPRRFRRGPGRGDDHDPGLQVRQVPADPGRRDRGHRAAGLPGRRRALRPAPAAPALFISAYGTRLLGHHAEAEFRRITAATGTGASAASPPRIHDLRHTFAVRTLAGWYRDGGDVAARMPLLSAYLGHVCPVSTYWYLHAVPELLALAAQRLENAQAAS